MIEIIVSNGTYIKDAPKAMIETIKQSLTMENPEYAKMKRFSKYPPSKKTLPYLEFFQVIDGILCVPRGVTNRVIKFFQNNNAKFFVSYETEKAVNDKNNFKFLGTPRDYQTKAIKAIVDGPDESMLVAGTGAGKTFTALAITVERQANTLIMVHSKELLYQWQGAIKELIGIDCGLIGDGEFDIKSITVGIINSIKKRTDELSEHFSQVIADECHRTSSSMWTKSLQELNPEFILGLTATPYRTDGLGDALPWCVGEIVHEVDKKSLHEKGYVLKPDVHRIETYCYHEYDGTYSKMLKALTEDEDRNNIIADTVVSDLNKHNDAVILLTDRINHANSMKALLLARGVHAEVLTGQLAAKKRKDLVKRLRAGEVEVLIATLSLVGEGFDLPDLTAVFYMCPVKSKNRVVQSAGRVLRPKDGKSKPRLYDFRDSEIPILDNQAYERDVIYWEEWNVWKD